MDALVQEKRKTKVLLVDMDALYESQPDKATELLDSFDLSVMPFVLQMDSKGIILHKYVQL